MSRSSRSIAWLDLTGHLLHLALPLACLLLARAPLVQAAAALMLYLGGFTLMHDAMHSALGLSARTHAWVLSLSGALIGVSGHAARVQHLHHHARPGSASDREMGGGERRTLALLREGLLGFLSLPVSSLRGGRRTRGRELFEWLLALMLHGSLVASGSAQALLFTGLTFLLHVTLPIWGGLVPHDPPAWLRWLAGALHGTYLPVFTGVADHAAHHERPRIPTYSLTRALERERARSTATATRALGTARARA